MHIFSQETWSRVVLAIVRDDTVLCPMEVKILKVVGELELFWNGVIIA